MKRTLFLLFLSLCSFASAQDSAYYTLEKTHYTISTYFEMRGTSYEGRVIRSYLNIRMIYDLYDKQKSYIAQGIAKTLSQGPSHPRARIIEVADAYGKKIGFIDGETRVGTNIIKYNFYDANNQLLAVTQFEAEDESFCLLGYSHEPRILGVVKRKQKGTDSWEIALQDTRTIPPELLRIFVAFIADHF